MNLKALPDLVSEVGQPTGQIGMGQAYVWFRTLDGFGEDAINLHECTRISVYAITNPGEQTIFESLTYYYNEPKSLWVQCGKSVEYEPSGSGGWEQAESESYRQVLPECAAHHLLKFDVFGGKLPDYLSEFVQFGDEDKFRLWSSKHRIADGSLRIESSKVPRWQMNCLYYGGKLCAQLSSRAKRQIRLLQAFEDNSWKNPVRNPFGAAGTLKDTVRAMKWEGSPIIFTQNGQTAHWRLG